MSLPVLDKLHCTLRQLLSFLQSIVGMAGTIFMWNGWFNIADMIGRSRSQLLLVAQLACTVIGGFVVLHVRYTEEAAEASREHEALFKNAAQGDWAQSLQSRSVCDAAYIYSFAPSRSMPVYHVYASPLSMCCLTQTKPHC
jgi:hypothetical protein